MADFTIEGVSKRFGAIQAVQDVTLHAADRAFFVLLGPTGAGKTTLLRLLAGLERPDTGRISIGGVDASALSPAARDVAFVFQQYSLYPHLTVFDNLAFPLRAPATRLPEPIIRARVEAAAATLRMGHKLQNRATALSGGEMQRVAIGRALVRSPAVTLMDEPLSSLDAALRAELRTELKRTQAELGATFLYVTHDQIEAMTMATQIGVMNQGRLVQVGTPQEIYEQPADVYVASRLGTPAINLLPADLVGGPALAGTPAPRGATTVGLRTEHLAISAHDDGPGRITRVERLGDQSHLHIALAGHRLTVLADPHAAYASGQPVMLTAAHSLWFNAAGARIAACNGNGVMA